MGRTRFFLASAAVFLAFALNGCGGSSSGGNSNGPLSITTSSAPQGVVGVAYNLTLAGRGGTTPYAWSLSNGSLPAGLMMTRDGVISGTPTANGSSSFTIGLTDSEHPPAVATAGLTIQINASLSITTSSLPDGKTGIPYSATLAATGGIAPYKWSVTQGSLPAGLMLDTSAGVISGTPMGPGTTNFTIGVSDSANPVENATVALSIVIAPPPPPPPPRGAAMYVQEIINFQFTDVAGLAIAKDGSLSPLASSPEPLPLGSVAVSSRTPSIFVLKNFFSLEVDALIENPDYSISPYTSTVIDTGGKYQFSTLAVDPTGQNLYLSIAPGYATSGVLVLTADGAFRTVQTLVTGSPVGTLVFTPDGEFGFSSVCPNPQSGSPAVLSFARAEDGTLTQVGSVTSDSCVTANQVSPDGKYLAVSGQNGIQIYSISASGTLTALLSPPVPVTACQGAYQARVSSLFWDDSSTYLLGATGIRGGGGILIGGLAVLRFAGSTLTETTEPCQDPLQSAVRSGSFIYAMDGYCFDNCIYGPIEGYSFENGQLTPLPKSPYSYGGTMVIY